MSATIDNDGSAVIQRQIDTDPALKCLQQLSPADALVLYEVEQTAAIITKGNYRRIALQFPDHLLGHSTIVSAELQRRIKCSTSGGDAQVFILADTSYGSCCVDEVAADHYSADLVVHYGRTCLTLSSRVPVYYVFGREPIDAEHVATAAAASAATLSGRRLLLLCDVLYAHAMPAVAQALGERGFDHVVVSEITAANRLYDPSGATSEEDSHATVVVPGRSWQLPPDASSLADYTVLYLGAESPTLTNIILTMRCQGVFSYDPITSTLREETHQVNRHLARRYKMVQHARDADVIGIVVGTLAATRYLRVVEALKAMIRRAHKKFYVFVVGKLNVAKLANFAEIETYVLVACPENSLIDSREFFSPVVTPYELQLALSKSRQWTGNYVTDFHAFLDDAERELAEEANIVAADDEDDDEDKPHFSLITGTFKQNRRFNDPRSSQSNTSALGSAELTTRNKHTEIAQYMGSAGAEYLLTRSFRGLGHDDDDNSSNDLNGDVKEPAVLAVEGRSGIARGYSNERK